MVHGCDHAASYLGLMRPGMNLKDFQSLLCAKSIGLHGYKRSSCEACHKVVLYGGVRGVEHVMCSGMYRTRPYSTEMTLCAIRSNDLVINADLRRRSN